MVADPADVARISRQNAQLFGELGDGRQPDPIDQSEGDSVGAREIEERLGEPVLVADLDGVTAGEWQALKITGEGRKEFVATGHRVLIQIEKLY
jgi:hypothetical protein